MTANITPSDLNQLLRQGNCYLIDVREAVEHAEERLPQAKLLPLSSLTAETCTDLPKDQPLVLMCRGGKRGEQAAAKLAAMGYSKLSNLDGGILGWKAAGLPVQKGERRGLPLMQQVQLTIGLGVLTGVILSRTVHPDWVFLSAFFGAGLVFAGSTGWCGLALLMAKMPWNKPKARGASCCSA
jgi:rhodanese-related sulfurtransferase